MLDILIFIFTSIGIGIIFAVPGILFGLFLENHGIASNRVRAAMATSIFFVFFSRIWYPQIPYILLAGGIILGTTTGLYRTEIYWAMKKNKESK